MKFPIEVEFSRIPVWLSWVAPIKVHAFSFGPWIFCRGAFSTRLRQHETIHFRQQVECLFAIQWALYLCWWFGLLFKYRGDARAAYRNIPFEREAYAHDIDPHYLETRKPFAWVRYICDDSCEP